MICIMESLRGHPDSAPTHPGTRCISLTGQLIFCGKVLLEVSLRMPSLCSTPWDSAYLLPPATSFYASGPLLLQEAFPGGAPPTDALPRKGLHSRSPPSPGVVLSKVPNSPGPRPLGLILPSPLSLPVPSAWPQLASGLQPSRPASLRGCSLHVAMPWWVVHVCGILLVPTLGSPSGQGLNQWSCLGHYRTQGMSAECAQVPGRSSLPDPATARPSARGHLRSPHPPTQGLRDHACPQACTMTTHT